MERSLRVLDGAVAVFDAVAGVEPQTETVWRQADRYAVPRICFVNKMDRTGADFERTVSMMVDRLQANPLVLQLPWGREADFVGVIDLVEMKARRWTGEIEEDWEDVEIPAEYVEAAKQAHHDLFEKLADHDESLMNKFVHEEEPTTEELRRAIRRATLAGEGVPVLCGSAFKNKAIQPLLDAVVSYLPAPTDVRPVEGHTLSGEHAERKPDDSEPFSALAFKIMSDTYVGRLTYIRVYSGVLRAGAHVVNSTKDRKERIGRILQMHANHREDMSSAFTGDIVAVVGLKHTTTGDTLAEPSKPIVLESISFPTPVISVAVEPRTKADNDKLGNGLSQALRRGPDVRRSLRRRDRPDGHLRDGRAAPRHHRGPPQARVQRRRQRRQAAGRLPRDHQEDGSQGRGAVHPTDRRPRPVRPRLHRPRADGPRRRLRVHQQGHRRQHPARVHPRRRPGHPGGSWSPASWPGTRSSTCARR